jgi:hypothetical protein
MMERTLNLITVRIGGIGPIAAIFSTSDSWQDSRCLVAFEKTLVDV